MCSVDFLAQEKIWFDKLRFDEAEKRFYEWMNGSSQQTQVSALSDRSSPVVLNSSLNLTRQSLMGQVGQKN